MLAKLRTAAFSALIGLGAIAALPASAQAEGVYLNYGTGHGAGIGVQFGGYDRYDYRRHDRRHDHRYNRFCTPQRAVDKAARLGVRGARVVDVDRRTIQVAGRKYGQRVRLTMGRTPNCPVIRW